MKKKTAAQLPRPGQHIRVHLVSWEFRCPCGGTGWSAKRPEKLTQRCVYRPDGRTECGKAVRWHRKPDRVEERWVGKLGTSVLGNPMVVLVRKRGSRRIEDRAWYAWTSQHLTGWEELS